MARKALLTKEEMIEAAFQLIREDGLSAFTARRLAEKLGCSTQPLMYRFPSLKQLLDLTYERADRFHTEYILKDDDFLEIGLRYIRFAGEEPHLFRFLFQSGRFDGFSLTDLIRDDANGPLISAAAKDLEMSEKQALDCFEILFALVHGYAGLIANNALVYDEESMRSILNKAAGGLMKAEKSELE